MELRTCPGCNEAKSVDEFNWKWKVKNRRQVRCRACTREQLKRHYLANKPYYVEKAKLRNDAVLEDQQRRILAYLEEHPCVECGESDVVCLEFDHVRGKKRGNVARMLGNHSWAVLEAEIANCEVRCANCHRRKTARQRGWYKAYLGSSVCSRLRLGVPRP